MTFDHAATPVEPPAGPDSEIAVVVPTYNEATNIAELIRRIAALPLPGLRIIVVDDGSPDGTADEAERVTAGLARRGPDFVSVIRRRSKDGLGRAYVAGMTKALAEGADYVVQMDADLSHQPEYLPQLLTTLVATGADVVIGSRYVPGGSLADEWKLHRRLLSGWANFYVNAILGLRIRDATAGFKIWRRQMLEQMGLEHIRSAGYSFQVEMNYVCQGLGGRLVEMPIHFHERSGGASKMTLRVKLESAKVPFELRWNGKRRVNTAMAPVSKHDRDDALRS